MHLCLPCSRGDEEEDMCKEGCKGWGKWRDMKGDKTGGKMRSSSDSLKESTCIHKSPREGKNYEFFKGKMFRSAIFFNV